MELRTQKVLGFSLGLPCGLATGLGILVAAATDRDHLGAALVVGGFVGGCVAALVMLRFRRPGDPL